MYAIRSYYVPGSQPGMNPNFVGDRNTDIDADGMSNYEEYVTIDIFAAGLSTSPLNPDTDGDGMADGWEMLYYNYLPVGDFNPVNDVRNNFV